MYFLCMIFESLFWLILGEIDERKLDQEAQDAWEMNPNKEEKDVG